MILQKIKRFLAVVSAGCMIFTVTVSAGDVQGTAASQTAANEDLTEDNSRPAENPLENRESPDGQTEESKEQKTDESLPAESMDSQKDAADQREETPEEKEEFPDISSDADRKDRGGTSENEGASEEESAPAEEEAAEEEQPDDRTRSLVEEYGMWLRQIRAQSVGSYSSELAKFPASYQTYLKKLHEKHPNWIFVAVDRSLNWDDIVTAESVSGTSSGMNRSLLPKTSNGLLLSKASTDYNVSKNTYIPKDGSTWVSASKPAVAYYTDPRNFLTDNYIYMFEALNYDSNYHRVEGVRNVLSGTDLYGNKQISYTTTDGKTAALKNMTYEQAIFAAGAKNKVSPLFLAAKIRQETGAKLSSGSISGNFSYGGKSYRGYYNYYNIGAYSTSTGSAVANGLVYAQGGKDKQKTYGRHCKESIS